MRLLLAILTLGFCISCATVLKEDTQEVLIVNDLKSEGMAMLTTRREGQLRLVKGKSHLQKWRRTKNKLQVGVNCPNQKGFDTYIKPNFDVKVGGVLNLLNLPVGWIVDAHNKRAYDYPKTIYLSSLCDNNESLAKIYPTKRR